MKCFLIAEAGVNHNGSVALALRLIEAAAASGADAVKFQTFHADRLVRAGAPKAAYQEAHTGEGDQQSMLRALELSEADHRVIVDRCAELNIEFMSTPFDAESAAFLISLGMKRIKVPSGELTNKPFLEYLAGFDLPLIVSTGMSTLEEVCVAVDWIAAARIQKGFVSPLSERVCLLHCTSNYPAAAADVNLLAMRTLADKLNLPVGYSDHTQGIAIGTAAVALGASVLEKHFTLDRGLKGPDHQASLEPDELAALVLAVREVNQSLGDGIKSPCLAELPIRDVARRSLTVVRDLFEGACISPDDLDILRPGTGIPPAAFDQIVGRRTSRSIAAGSTLVWDDLV